jgi:hypothetical protein
MPKLHVVDAVRVVLLRLREDDDGALPMLDGRAQVEHDHIREDDHQLGHDGYHVGCCCWAAVRARTTCASKEKPFAGW